MEWEDGGNRGHMKCEFHRGDVIVQIGWSSAYVVVCPCIVTDGFVKSTWYRLKYLGYGGIVCYTNIPVATIESDYVKVGFCKNISSMEEVCKALNPIEHAFGLDREP